MDSEDFRDKKVVVMGLGLHGGGEGVVRFFAELGSRVLVTDLKTKKDLLPSIERLKDYNIEYVLGEHRLKDFRNADLIIKGPSIPFDSIYIQEAINKNITIDTDVGIFLHFCPSKNVIGITGTKGKSTVATLIYTFLKEKHTDVLLAGNIRASVLDKVKEIKENTIVVLELSSWQLAGIEMHKKSPHVAVVTNVMPDHMDYYKRMSDYIEDKKIIFKYQTEDDFLVLNHDNEITRSFGKEAVSKVCFYSLKDNEPLVNNIQIKGEHNILNIRAAIIVARLYDVEEELIKEAISRFAGVPYRLQKLIEINGILFYNDTTATMPDAACAALLSFEKPIVLIAGGADKNLSFKKLGSLIAKKVKALVLLDGKASKRLQRSVENELLKSGKEILIKKANSMERAANLAFGMAEKGDIVLLSPGCSSFGMFKHEFDRGKKFNEAVERLQKDKKNEQNLKI